MKKGVVSILGRARRALAFRYRYWLINVYPLWRARAVDSLRYGLRPYPPFRDQDRPVSVKVFCQVKDDSDIIEDWILWHSYLFGGASLVLIADRPSAKTADILRKYSFASLILEAPLGNWPQELGWDDKRTYNINRAIKDYGTGADFVIPLDADEFIIFEHSPCKAGVLRELRHLRDAGNFGFKFSREFEACSLETMSRPAVEIRTFREAHSAIDFRKCFAKSGQLEWVGAGQCYVHTLDGKDPIVVRLALLHFRWRGFDHMYEKCVDHVSQLVVLPDGSTKPPRVGGHVLEGAQAIQAGRFQAWARQRPRRLSFRSLDGERMGEGGGAGRLSDLPASAPAEAHRPPARSAPLPHR
ncbi:MAG: glycosyltransferase family 2 protein [Synechococcaceae cyanobacterium MAG-AL1]|nr:glycosyltransferase family 2 protein [Candidatus Regnicoccus frigidus MAG-AL1]